MDDYWAIGASCMALHLRRAARAIGRVYDDALRPAGLSNGQFSLMAMLAARDDWTMQALANALGLDQSSLSAAVKPLLRRALIERGEARGDRRFRTLGLTAEGRALLEAARPLWRLAQDRAEQLLDGHDTARLRTTLRALA